MNHTRASFALLLSLFVLTGCAGLPVARDLKTEAHSGYGLLTTKPRVSRTADGLLVSGYVARGAFYSGSARMHLDVEVVSPEGVRLAFAPTTFFPNPIPHRRHIASSADYTERIHGDFPSGSRVRVMLHPTSKSECLVAVSPSL